MKANSKIRYDRIKLIATFLTVGIISLVQPGCDCSSSSGGSGTPTPVTAVSPLSNSTTALVTENINAVFGYEMDGTTVESAFTLTINSNPVAASVSYDATTKSATLTPSADLASSTEYRATIASSVKDINGNSPLTSDYIWTFTTSPSMQLVSKNLNGVTSNDLTLNADIDATGRYVVFESESTILVNISTTANRSHIYRKDNVTGEVLLVSSDKSGLVEANNNANNPSISSNGRYVVFQSLADNLDGNTNGVQQIYLKDLDNNNVIIASRNISGVPDNGLSGASNASVSDDGRYILFQTSDATMSALNSSFIQVYRKDLSSGTVEMISRTAAGVPGDAASSNADMNTDGAHIVFESTATNLPSSSSWSHTYYVDTSVTHNVEQVSVNSNGDDADAGSFAPSISDDGSTIVFHSDATNLDSLDNNGASDIYLRYRPSNFTRMISANPNTSASGNAASSYAHISGNGEYVTFESLASDLDSSSTPSVAGIYVRNLSVWPQIVIKKLDLPASTIDSSRPSISTDGRYVSFDSVESFTIDDTDTLRDVFKVHNSTGQ